jgi:hypothetical protein
MRAFLLGAAILALSACGNSSDDDDMNPVDPVDPTDPTDPPTPEETARDYDELASILAAHVRGEFQLQLAAAEISESRLPAGFSITSAGLEESTGVGTIGSMSYDFAFHCNDGTAAHTIVPCDGNAHHSHIKFTATGGMVVGTMSMDQITRVVDWEIRDLTLDKARFRGPDQISLKTVATTDGETASYGVQFTATYEQVRYLPSHTMPTFGTIDFTVNTERLRGDDRRVFNSTAHLVYGASGTPTTLSIDGTHNYTINLTSGDVVKL